ncbi:MAG: hypothetical protein ABS44_09125 [Chryseobacterium sp. SCN 40-13]|nr:MAG: hypothetical protein ABS44_09125 [Chryseobacterium sp. SCN 40-13]
MEKLNLLFTQDGLQYQMVRGKSVQDEQSYFMKEESPTDFISRKLEMALDKKHSEISVVSALNRFTLMPEGFSEHEMGYDLIAFNSPVNKNEEELMLSVNKKYGVQFYYTFPKKWYEMLKSRELPVKFNFSGEKFLNSISAKGGKEIHINLYHQQCEFIALENKKVILYNNLDINSEVDFLYFIMFSISKIGFGIKETRFFVYGETSENETFISELRKFVRHLKIIHDNQPKKNFILK